LSDSSDTHHRVAFPLPYIPLVFRWVRPKLYPESPTTLGEHLRKRRHELGLMQKEVASRLAVNTWTYLLWEQDRTTPTVRYYPAIFDFLGYDPFPAPTTLPQQIASRRRELGISIKEAAKRLGVDEGTFGRWESGEWKPRMSQKAVEQFLATTLNRRIRV
jgi:transcriptional regulator with XRE-family HTH domain